MASNGNEYYNAQYHHHQQQQQQQQQPQFRRATGRVATGSVAPPIAASGNVPMNAGYPVHHHAGDSGGGGMPYSNQPQYGNGNSNGTNGSAIPAPYIQQQLPPASYYSSMAPPAQSYSQPPQQQQPVYEPQHLANNFQRMNVSQQRPPTPKRSPETLRKREKQLEADYDEDDGRIAPSDMDASLFPSDTRQVIRAGRSENKYGVAPAGSATATTMSSPNTSSGKNTRTTYINSHYSPRTTPRKPIPTTTTIVNLLSPLDKCRKHNCHRHLSIGGNGAKSRALVRRHSSIIHNHHSYPNSSSSSGLQPLTPLPPRWQKCSNCAATSTNKPPSPPKQNTSNNNVARNPMAPPPGHSNRGSPHSSMHPLPPHRPATGHQHHMIMANHQPQQQLPQPGAINSMPNSMINSPVISKGANGPNPVYAQDNGFDSSDRVHLGGRNLPSYQQQQQQQQQPPPLKHIYSEPHAPYSTDALPQRNSSPYGIHPGGYQNPHQRHLSQHTSYHEGSVYSNSSSGDGLAMAGGDMGGGPLPHPGSNRAWNGSSRSLPMNGPPILHSESQNTSGGGNAQTTSSGSSSQVGTGPMGNIPSAKTLGASPLSKPPPPTAASLEAYRASIRRSNDPEAQLEFAKYVLEHARGMADQERGPKQAAMRYDILVGEGMKWVKKLAGSGITVHRTNIAAEAQFFLGTVYSQGIYGTQRDDAKAFAYYQHASKAQHAEANYRTAVCYEVGVGTKKDATRALQFYRKAASQSNVPAMYKLGVILIKGLLGVTASVREGINWLKRAADNATPECPHALHELALCHEATNIEEVIPDPSYSRQLYIKAGKLGYVPSQVRLGQGYEYGTLDCPVDPRKSIGWYTRAAEKNDPEAELALSGWYLTGSAGILPQNDVEAYLWARRAADRGLAKAEYAVGYYYECGIGVSKPDVHEAQKWYNKAARKQNRRAINRLRELKQMGVNGAPPRPGTGMSRPQRNKGAGSMF